MTKVTLPYDFTHREYQVEPWNEIMKDTFKRGILVVPRRCGKDILCWNALIAKAMKRRALYYYMAPYYNQVRQIIWEGFDFVGRRFLDYIPPELVAGKTKLDMRIDLINGSQIKLQGSDNIDRIVGTNPFGIVFTEFSLHKPEAWGLMRPVLAENGGWGLFNGTPRGQNHMFHLYEDALKNPSWYVQYLTRDDTGIPTLEAIQEDLDSGMPEELARQEYWCSWMSGVVGSYYAKLLENSRNNQRITRVPHEPALPVFTSWDLGIGDATAIWFIQFWGKEVRIINYYENTGRPLTHYIDYCKSLDYVYEEHFAPHDISVREYSSGRSRIDIAAEHKFFFTPVPKEPLEDGIEAVKTVIPLCWFDEVACRDGVFALMNYQARYSEKARVKSRPLHNWASHGADAFRTFAQMYDTIRPERQHAQYKRKVIRSL